MRAEVCSCCRKKKAVQTNPFDEPELPDSEPEPTTKKRCKVQFTGCAEDGGKKKQTLNEVDIANVAGPAKKEEDYNVDIEKIVHGGRNSDPLNSVAWQCEKNDLPKPNPDTSVNKFLDNGNPFAVGKRDYKEKKKRIDFDRVDIQEI